MKKILLIVALSPILAFASPDMTREYCTSGESGQEVSACLKEMRNSKAERHFHSSDYQKNKLERCASVPDRALCEARVLEGTTSGEVKGGGTITELTVIEVPAVR